MVYCALCKQNKESKYNWVIYESGVNGPVRKYKICDDCAITVIKQISHDILGLRENEELTFPLEISKLGVIESVYLLDNGEIEIILKVDYSQAKRIIEKKKEQDAIKEIS